VAGGSPRGHPSGRRVHGSGCLAVLLARHFKGARVTRSDLSPGALEVAAINVRRHRLGGRVRWSRADLLSGGPAGRYDVIVSNPPYEPSAHVDALPRGVRREPRLRPGRRPGRPRLVRRLVREAARRLKPSGILIDRVGGAAMRSSASSAASSRTGSTPRTGSDCVCLIQAARLPAPSRPGEVVEGVPGRAGSGARGRACASPRAGGPGGRSGSLLAAEVLEVRRSTGDSRGGPLVPRGRVDRVGTFRRRRGPAEPVSSRSRVHEPHRDGAPDAQRLEDHAAGSFSSWTVREQDDPVEVRSGKALENSVMSPW